MWGVKYKDGKIAGDKIEPIKGILKRGMWNYQLNDPAFTEQVVKLDNGLTMDLGKMQQLINEKKEFMAERKKMLEVLKEPEPKVKEVKKGGKTPVKAAAKKK